MKLINTVCAVVLSLLACSAMVSTAQAKESTTPASVEQKQAEKVNLNTADAKQIAKTMKGIGLKKAEAIVAFRKANGPFKNLEDLLRIKGIGAATLAKNAHVVTL